MSMDTLEDLAKFVQDSIVEMNSNLASTVLDSSDYDYYEGCLEAYLVIDNKIKEILNK